MDVGEVVGKKDRNGVVDEKLNDVIEESNVKNESVIVKEESSSVGENSQVQKSNGSDGEENRRNVDGQDVEVEDEEKKCVPRQRISLKWKYVSEKRMESAVLMEFIGSASESEEDKVMDESETHEIKEETKKRLVKRTIEINESNFIELPKAKRSRVFLPPMSSSNDLLSHPLTQAQLAPLKKSIFVHLYNDGFRKLDAPPMKVALGNKSNAITGNNPAAGSTGTVTAQLSDTQVQQMKFPYHRQSKTFLESLEYGVLPPRDDMPPESCCTYYNGCLVAEIIDHRTNVRIQRAKGFPLLLPSTPSNSDSVSPENRYILLRPDNLKRCELSSELGEPKKIVERETLECLLTVPPEKLDGELQPVPFGNSKHFERPQKSTGQTSVQKSSGTALEKKLGEMHRRSAAALGLLVSTRAQEQRSQRKKAAAAVESTLQLPEKKEMVSGDTDAVLHLSQAALKSSRPATSQERLRTVRLVAAGSHASSRSAGSTANSANAAAAAAAAGAKSRIQSAAMGSSESLGARASDAGTPFCMLDVIRRAGRGCECIVWRGFIGERKPADMFRVSLGNMREASLFADQFRQLASLEGFRVVHDSASPHLSGNRSNVPAESVAAMKAAASKSSAFQLNSATDSAFNAFKVSDQKLPPSRAPTTQFNMQQQMQLQQQKNPASAAAAAAQLAMNPGNMRAQQASPLPLTNPATSQQQPKATTAAGKPVVQQKASPSKANQPMTAQRAAPSAPTTPRGGGAAGRQVRQPTGSPAAQQARIQKNNPLQQNQSNPQQQQQPPSPSPK